MAQASAFQTYDAVGNKEDLLEIITNISPTETPMFSDFGKTKATAVYHEWTKDSLATATTNAQIEGYDYSFAKVTARTRVGNYTQIFSTLVEVSDTQRTVNVAGLDDEYAYQMAKKLKEHARDIEYSLASTASTGNSGSSGTARTLKGVMSWLTSVNETGTGTGNEALTETMFNDALEDIWTNGGRPDVVYCNGWQKRKISGFSASNTKTIEAGAKKLIAAIDVYESDFGLLKIKADRYMNPAQIAILQSDMWKIAVLRPTKQFEVAKIGSATRGVIETELTLEARAQESSGKITQLSTS
jgi:hypothetical protein